MASTTPRDPLYKKQWASPQIITSVGTPLFDAQFFVDTVVHIDPAQDVLAVDLVIAQAEQLIGALPQRDRVKYRVYFTGAECWRQMEYWLKEVPIVSVPLVFSKYDVLEKNLKPSPVSIQAETNLIISFFLKEIDVLKQEILAWRQHLQEQKESIEDV